MHSSLQSAVASLVTFNVSQWSFSFLFCIFNRLGPCYTTYYLIYWAGLACGPRKTLVNSTCYIPPSWNRSIPDTLWVHLSSKIVSNSSLTKTTAPRCGYENDTWESIKNPIKVRMYDTTASLLLCPVILSWNRIRLVWQNLFLASLCWLLHDSFCYAKSCCTEGDPKSGRYFISQSSKQGWEEALGDSICILTSTFRHFVKKSLA